MADLRHAQAYSPLWDAQLGLWTDKAVRQGLNTRQIDENIVVNLAATRPDLLTGVDPATGNPAQYGSVEVDINCAVIGFIDKAPTVNLVEPARTPSSLHADQTRRRDAAGPDRGPPRHPPNNSAGLECGDARAASERRQWLGFLIDLVGLPLPSDGAPQAEPATKKVA